jgi:hypothetical protein
MRERRGEREAWTKFFEGGEAKKENKYGNERTGKYASKLEAEVAENLAAAERSGKIFNLREQVPIVLVPSNGKLRAIKYVADFVYQDSEGKTHVLDSKGFKTQVYRLKKKMAALLLGIEIEEV